MPLGSPKAYRWVRQVVQQGPSGGSPCIHASVKETCGPALPTHPSAHLLLHGSFNQAQAEAF